MFGSEARALFRCSTLGLLLALPTNIRPGWGWKSLPGTNTIFLWTCVNYSFKKFYKIGLRWHLGQYGDRHWGVRARPVDRRVYRGDDSALGILLLQDLPEQQLWARSWSRLLWQVSYYNAWQPTHSFEQSQLTCCLPVGNAQRIQAVPPYNFLIS